VIAHGRPDDRIVKGLVMTVAVAVSALLAGACTADDGTEVEVRRELDVSGVTVTDVFAPRDADQLPVVVMLHGTGGEHHVMDPLAQALAEEGVVVYVPTWPVIDQLDPYPADDDEPYRRQAEAVVCALRFARRTAVEFGGDPDDITVFGHSGGATVGARAALVATPPWPGIDCDPWVSHRPRRFIATGGDFYGVYQDATECPELYAPYDPFAIEASNTDLEVRLIHGYYDTAVDARVGQLFDRHLDDCGVDSAFVGTDTGHSELRDPSTPAGAFVVDQIAALVHGRDSVFAGPADAAVVEFAEDGTCRYDGPASMPLGESLAIEFRNATAGELHWFALVRLRPEVPVTLAQLRADPTPIGDRAPPFVSYGGFLSVRAGTTEELDWVFVDGDASWAVFCMRDPDPANPMTWPSVVFWGGNALEPAAIISPEPGPHNAAR
jgi:acetyl esterase/lipase